MTVASARAPSHTPSRLLLGSLLATLVTTLATAQRVLEGPEAPRQLVTPMLAIAALLLALLARQRVPGLAWCALSAASLLGSSIPIAAVQLVNARPHTLPEWIGPALAVVAATVGTVTVAALYATRPDRRLGDWVVPVVVVAAGWLAAACVLVVVLVAAGMRADPAFTWADVATMPTTLYLHLILLLIAIGAAGDARVALERADARITANGSPGNWRQRLRATAEELLPGASEQHAQGVEAERRRLASDLHASVLPALRRAIAEAEAGAGPETLASRLWAVDLELERLLADRWPIVLETLGLIVALEELAEDVQANGPIVEIDVRHSTGRPPAGVERAAYRIGQLALDNAVRHAAATRIRIDVATAQERLEVIVADNGQGLDRDEIEAATRSGRGLADQRRVADAVGARLVVGRSSEGGLSVAFDWRRASARSGFSRVRRDG